MTLKTQQLDRLEDDLEDFGRSERFSHRQQGECPVRSHASRTRARMRSRGGAVRDKRRGPSTAPIAAVGTNTTAPVSDSPRSATAIVLACHLIYATCFSVLFNFLGVAS